MDGCSFKNLVMVSRSEEPDGRALKASEFGDLESGFRDRSRPYSLFEVWKKRSSTTLIACGVLKTLSLTYSERTCHVSRRSLREELSDDLQLPKLHGPE